MITNSTLGVIGGYGSLASLEFQKILLTSHLHKVSKDSDFPSYILLNVTQGDIIDLDGTAVNELELFEFLKEHKNTLKNTNEVIILCNSFYYYLESFEKILEKNIVSLPDLVEYSISYFDFKRPLIVGSEFTKEYNLYSSSLYEPVFYTNKNMISESVKGIIEDKYVDDILLKAKEENVDSIVLACTDLTFYRDILRKKTPLEIIDSVEVAASYFTQKGELNESNK